jgi:DNA invertase Pin-like site-specific DNA recombinase
MTGRIMRAMNAMLLDMLAAVARKDYTDRRRRQAEGIKQRTAAASAKGETLYKGRKENVARNTAIMGMLERGESWDSIQKAVGCSRSTISRMLERVRAQAI